jgi:hypothetical protein
MSSSAQMSLGMPQDTSIKNRHRESRHQQKTPYLSQAIQGMPLDKKLENRRRASRRRHKTIFCADGLREAIGHEIGNPTPSIATPFVETPPHDAIFNTDEHRDTIRHAFWKPTPFSADERPGVIENDAGKPTSSVMTPPKYAMFRAGEPRDATGTTLENRRRASRHLTSRRRLRNVNEANRSLGTPYDTILANRRRASRRKEKIGKKAETSHGIHITLANRRRA